MTNSESSNPSMFRWLVFVLLLMFIYHIREVFPPFIVGGIIAYLLFPLVTTVNKLNRFALFRWMNPKLAILFIYLTTAVVLGVLAYKFGPTLAEQVSNFIDQRHEIVRNLVTQISTHFNMDLNVEETSHQILATVEGSIGKPEELVHLGGLLSHGLLSLLVCIVSSIYFMVDSRRVGKFFLRFVPDKSKVTAVNMIAQMNLMLSKYVVGQLVLIILMSCVAGIFLSLLKMKYALVIAILSGIFEIIPVLGPFIAISIAVIVGVSQFGVPIAPWIILFYFVARQLEDYYVIPLIIGRAVELHALAVIFAVLVGETMAGALGMLIAIPVAASIKVMLDTFYPPEEHAPPAHEEPNIVARIVQFVFSPMRKRNDENTTGSPGPGSSSTNPQSQPTTATRQSDSNGEAEQKAKLIEWAHNKGHNEENVIKSIAKEEAFRTEKAELLESARLAQIAKSKPIEQNTDAASCELPVDDKTTAWPHAGSPPLMKGTQAEAKSVEVDAMPGKADAKAAQSEAKAQANEKVAPVGAKTDPKAAPTETEPTPPEAKSTPAVSDQKREKPPAS